MHAIRPGVTAQANAASPSAKPRTMLRMEKTSHCGTANGAEDASHGTIQGTPKVFTDAKEDGIYNAAEDARRYQQGNAFLGKLIGRGIQYPVNVGGYRHQIIGKRHFIHPTNSF